MDWFEAEGFGFAFEGDAVVGVDQIDAVGPAGIGVLGRIAEFVQNGREFDSRSPHAEAGDLRAILVVFGAGEDDLILDVAFHLPDITGMSFGDVHGQERNPIFVLLVELIQGGKLAERAVKCNCRK